MNENQILLAMPKGKKPSQAGSEKGIFTNKSKVRNNWASF